MLPSFAREPYDEQDSVLLMGATDLLISVMYHLDTYLRSETKRPLLAAPIESWPISVPAYALFRDGIWHYYVGVLYARSTATVQVPSTDAKGRPHLLHLLCLDADSDLLQTIPRHINLYCLGRRTRLFGHPELGNQVSAFLEQVYQVTLNPPAPALVPRNQLTLADFDPFLVPQNTKNPLQEEIVRQRHFREQRLRRLQVFVTVLAICGIFLILLPVLLPLLTHSPVHLSNLLIVLTGILIFFLSLHWLAQ